MKEYDISVIIPMYNTEKYIGQCIESVLNQTKDNIEIVVVNDGSTDSSLAISKAYADNHDNVLIIDKPNQGVISARIAGLNAAHGKYIGWVDSDDFVEPNMFEVLYNIILERDLDCAYCNLDFYPKNVRYKSAWFKEYKGTKDWNFIERNSQCWHYLTKRELLNQIGIQELFAEFDEYAWIAVMIHAEKIGYTDKELYHYRVGHQSLSGGSYKGKVGQFEEGAEISSKLKKLIKDTPYEQELDEYFDYRYIYALLMLEIVAAINSDKEAYKKAAKELKRMDFRKNKYTKVILDNNYGKLKSFVVRNLVTMSYGLAKIITSVVF